MLSASEPARTATPIGKSASAFKLKPSTLLTELLDALDKELELVVTTLDDELENEDELELEGAIELIETLELELAPTTP